MHHRGSLVSLAAAICAVSVAAVGQGITVRAVVNDVKPEPAPRPVKAPDVRKRERMSIQEAMARTGTTTPKAALDALKKENSRYRYLPHVGNRQREKEARRQAKAAAKAARSA